MEYVMTEKTYEDILFEAIDLQYELLSSDNFLLEAAGVGDKSVWQKIIDWFFALIDKLYNLLFSKIRLHRGFITKYEETIMKTTLKHGNENKIEGNIRYTTEKEIESIAKLFDPNTYNIYLNADKSNTKENGYIDKNILQEGYEKLLCGKNKSYSIDDINSKKGILITKLRTIIENVTNNRTKILELRARETEADAMIKKYKKEKMSREEITEKTEAFRRNLSNEAETYNVKNKVLIAHSNELVKVLKLFISNVTNESIEYSDDITTKFIENQYEYECNVLHNVIMCEASNNPSGDNKIDEINKAISSAKTNLNIFTDDNLVKQSITAKKINDTFNSILKDFSSIDISDYNKTKTVRSKYRVYDESPVMNFDNFDSLLDIANSVYDGTNIIKNNDIETAKKVVSAHNSMKLSYKDIKNRLTLGYLGKKKINIPNTKNINIRKIISDLSRPKNVIDKEYTYDDIVKEYESLKKDIKNTSPRYMISSKMVPVVNCGSYLPSRVPNGLSDEDMVIYKKFIDIKYKLLQAVQDVSGELYTNKFVVQFEKELQSFRLITMFKK